MSKTISSYIQQMNEYKELKSFISTLSQEEAVAFIQENLEHFPSILQIEYLHLV